MAENNIKVRHIQKHDIEENWNKAINFIPKAGEIIVYDIDKTYDYERIKVGDGETKVINLPFLYEGISNDMIDTMFSKSSGGGSIV